MEVKVFRNEGKYFATFLHFKTTVKKYKIKKNTELLVPEPIDFNFNLLENNLDIFNKKFNLLSPYIELKELNNPKEFYILTLIDENRLEYPFYISYNEMYEINEETNPYLYNFNFPIFRDKKNEDLRFYLKGIFGDLHQITLKDIKNQQECFFKIPNKSLLESEVYKIIVEKNGEQIYKNDFPIIVKETISFASLIEEFNNFYKINISPKLNFCILDKVEIFFNNKKIIHDEKNKLDLNKVIKNIIFYLPKSEIEEFKTIKIKYRLTESKVYSKSIENEILLDVFKNNEKIEILNIKKDYNYQTDSYKISWENLNKNKNLLYKFKIQGEEILTRDTFITLSDLKKMNNNNFEIPFELSCYNSIEKEIIKINSYIENYRYIDSSTPFTPIIDYSDSLYCEKPFGLIKWNKPSFRHYAKIRIRSLIDKKFLDEFKNPWLKSYILDKEVQEFDKKYTNYEEEIVYNFNLDKENSKKVEEATISYENKNDGWVLIENCNFYKIPLWFNSPGEKYEIELEIYNLFNEKVGEAKSNFIVKDYEVPEISSEDILINRNQFLQFGETGTVGEFFKIENPRPMDVKNSYDPTLKTFLGQELNDKTNIDHNGHSLYYYFNTIEGEFLNINYRRKFNFVKIKISFFQKEVKIYEIEHIPVSNDFKDNLIKIPKNIFFKGEYIMHIQTFNSSNQQSRIKELTFHANNLKPEKPFIRIKADDFSEDLEGVITINKKYFEIEVTNNDISNNYAGYKFKETHFYFRSLNVPFLEFPDYVIQTNVSDGSLVLKNNTPIENGDYECKIINYDYAGNASDPYIFTFKLRSEIKIIPESLFSNKPKQKMKWTIQKSQDSDGFFRFFQYSKDGINYTDYPTLKIESQYYPDRNQEQSIELDINWLIENNEYLEGYYRLVCYEFSRKHPEGQKEYSFYSPIVQVDELANPSNPIYAKKLKNEVEVFEEGTYKEWTYTSDLNKIVFESLHTEMVNDNPDTPSIETMSYKIILIEPSAPGANKNTYQAIIPQPLTIGNFQFNEIATKCGITNQKEGVWELRFVTIDKLGNSNENRGYYTYRISLVKRNPEINNATLSTNNSSKYFGLYSDKIGFYIDTTEIYKNIENYSEFKDKFPIKTFKIKFIENPFNNQYEITGKIDDKNCLEVLNKLTENDKINHSKDGRYNVLLSCIDPLGRSSMQVNRFFYIDTTTNAKINFVNSNNFQNKIVTLTATAVDSTKKVYYKTSNETTSIPEYNLDEIKKWKFELAKNISIAGDQCYGIELINLQYETDGLKTLFYVIEEESGNIGEIKTYNFKIDTSNSLIPIFDFENKIYYTKDDEAINISWGKSSKDIEKFEVKLDKIEIDNAGNINVIRSYAIQVDNLSTVIPVGPGENAFINMDNTNKIRIKLDHNSFLITGQYMFTVKGYNKYGTVETNNFIFQIDYISLTDISQEIVNNRITLDNNLITWNQIKFCDFYEVSYDNKNWIKTFENKFFINSENLIKENDGYSYIYMKWKSKNGVYSKPSKIKLLTCLERIKKPILEFFTDVITEQNKLLKWKVIIENPEKIKGIYYSFDKINWLYKNVTGRENYIINENLNYPVEDGIYDVFVIAVDEDPSITDFFNKSEIAYSYSEIFSKPIPKPIFNGLKSGMTLNNPVNLFIENKIKNVTYYIYVNGMLVNEGFEIASSSLRKFNIEIKAKKYGINKVFEVLTINDDYHLYSYCNSEYTIDINNSQLILSVDEKNNSLIIKSSPSLKNNQIIFYKEKNNENSKWAIIRSGDSLSLEKEWDFKVSTVSVI